MPAAASSETGQQLGRLIRGAPRSRWARVATLAVGLLTLGAVPALALAEEEPPPPGITTVTPATTTAPLPPAPDPAPAPAQPAAKPKPKPKAKPAASPPPPPSAAAPSTPPPAPAVAAEQEQSAPAQAKRRSATAAKPAPAPKPQRKAKQTATPKPQPPQPARTGPPTRVSALGGAPPRSEPAAEIVRWPRVAAVPLTGAADRSRDRLGPLLVLVVGIPLAALVVVAASSLVAGRAASLAWIAGRRMEVSVAVFSIVIGFGLALLLSNA